MKHSTTRWVTLRKVVVRLIEQHENSKEYFQNFLPKTIGFRDVKETPRYKRIKKILSEEDTFRYLSFVVYFATEFEMFLKKFQTMRPLVNIEKWKTFCETLWANLSDQNICVISRTETKQKCLQLKFCR